MRQMKDSGVKWIGEVPDGWKVTRIKSIYKERTELSETGEEELLSVSEYYGVKPTKEKTEEGEYLTRAESLIGYKKCFKGDFVSNIMLAWKGSFGTTSYDGIVSPAYCVYEPSENISPDYYHYLFRTNLYTSRFKSYSKGIIDSRLRLYSQYFYGVETILPPLPEQQRIASYLDEKCGDIDRCVSVQEEMIEELKAYKQSVITEAVTKGLDPNAKMKDSGIEWIREIPEGWNICRVKNVCSTNNESLSENTNSNFKFDYVDIGSVSFENGISKTERYVFRNAPSRARKLVKLNDVIVSTVRTYLRAIDIIDSDEKSNYVYSTGFAIMHPSDSMSPNYLIHICRSELFTTQVSLLSSGINYPSINDSNLRRIFVPLPPLSEQQAIAAYLDTKTAEIDSLIALKQQKITELKDYKKSLIYECVTGKKEIV